VTGEEKKAMTHSTGDIMPPVSDGAVAREEEKQMKRCFFFFKMNGRKREVHNVECR